MSAATSGPNNGNNHNFHTSRISQAPSPCLYCTKHKRKLTFSKRLPHKVRSPGAGDGTTGDFPPVAQWAYPVASILQQQQQSSPLKCLCSCKQSAQLVPATDTVLLFSLPTPDDVCTVEKFNTTDDDSVTHSSCRND